MSNDVGFVCSCCGKHHGALPLSFHAHAPDYWTSDLADDPNSELTSDQCVIQGEHFFVHGLIEIPVIDTGETFSWGVWVSLSKANFIHMSEHWNEPGREENPPYFGWLSTHLSEYQPTTLNLKTNVHTQPVGNRPIVELEPIDHPLAVERRTGITQARVQTLTHR